MAADKTLVIGSTGHTHVGCVEWRNALDVNVVDFDLVVVNCRPLTSAFLGSLPHGFFEKLRTRFTRLLDSGGRIVALGIASERAKNGRYSRPDDTYSWSPIDITTMPEAGDTIKAVTGDFSSYLARLQRWEYWYAVPSSCLTHELSNFYGGVAKNDFGIEMKNIATNRYGRALATVLATTVRRPKGATIELGPIVLLPDIPELDPREAMNLVLEDLLGFPQTTLPPEWAEGVSVPGIAELATDIEERRRTIESIEGVIATLESRKAELEWYRKLLYESGTELERVFSKCLEMMGGQITPARYSQEEFVLDFEGQRCLVECKGVAKSAALTHLRQLTSYILQYQEDEGEAGRGVLFVNAWRTLPLAERVGEGTPTFPPNVIDQAAQFGIALVSSAEFFRVFCEFLEGRVDGTAVLRKLATSNGVVNFT